jgi:5'-methylthioadenosine phosphorylase
MLAIIGGTGFYDLPALVVQERLSGETPFGPASGEILRGTVGGQALLFLARHGKGHRLLPHEVNYRANVFALKQAGATMILGFSAVGSLTQEITPGSLAMPEQYMDFTKGRREQTFFGGGVIGHVSTAKPVSAKMVQAVQAAALRAGVIVHRNLTYACVEGTSLGTQAESNFFRQAGCHLVGMTNVPEVFLAREAQLGYATLGLVTDYDCWLDDDLHHANVKDILEQYAETLVKAMSVLTALINGPLPEPETEIRTALHSAVLTPDSALSEAQKRWLTVLRR